MRNKLRIKNIIIALLLIYVVIQLILIIKQCDLDSTNRVSEAKFLSNKFKPVQKSSVFYGNLSSMSEHKNMRSSGYLGLLTIQDTINVGFIVEPQSNKKYRNLIESLEIGDSISKKMNSDTLKIIKKSNGETILWVFDYKAIEKYYSRYQK